jgi:hypothetical protein
MPRVPPRGLGGLVALVVVPAVPTRIGGQSDGQRPGDQIAPGFPESLQLVQLFLFFEIEMRRHE